MNQPASSMAHGPGLGPGRSRHDTQEVTGSSPVWPTDDGRTALGGPSSQVRHCVQPISVTCCTALGALSRCTCGSSTAVWCSSVFCQWCSIAMVSGANVRKMNRRRGARGVTQTLTRRSCSRPRSSNRTVDHHRYRTRVVRTRCGPSCRATCPAWSRARYRAARTPYRPRGR